ncbi:MAG TPA: hypothetical protein VMW72_21210 [Sedimentisphaerales bacterium]|nr:hypothetical protein [Sedimentisphaerales bacterium]
MTEQQINEAYKQLYSVEDDNKKRSVLEQLRTEAEQLGLKDWVLLTEARLALVNLQYDIAIDLSTSLLDYPELTSELRAWALLNRGFTYGKLDPPRTEDEIADYTAVIEMPDALVEQKPRAFLNRGITYGQLDPPRTEDAIDDYIDIIEMPDATAEHKAGALINRGITYSQLETPRIEDAIADFTAVIKMLDASSKSKASAILMRGITYNLKGEQKKAKDDLLEAKKFFEKIDDKDRIKSIDFMLSRLDVLNKDLSQEDQEIIQAVSSPASTDKQLSIEDKIINDFTAKKTTVYDEYNKRRPSTYIKGTDAENEVILAILKGWGSAVPLVLGGEGACRGGGYFLKFNVPFGEWEKIPRLQAKTLVLFRHGALSQIQPYDI